jgi:hypothetical protein
MHGPGNPGGCRVYRSVVLKRQYFKSPLSAFSMSYYIPYLLLGVRYIRATLDKGPRCRDQ